MIWREAIRKTGEFLDLKGVPDAPTASELMAARLLGCSRGFLVSHLEKEVSEKHLEALRRGMRRLAAGEPLQYVLGEWDFRTLTLKCDKRALIPRPETEDLVERVLAHLKTEYGGNKTPFVVDVGTGSGCIILSLANVLYLSCQTLIFEHHLLLSPILSLIFATVFFLFLRLKQIGIELFHRLRKTSSDF
ncbi:MAG: hypothetical protein IKV56_03415 [Kiritimatiellae bacterium]|nr:hypothetical protein [Kiritimatiellia bacterium]